MNPERAMEYADRLQNAFDDVHVQAVREPITVVAKRHKGRERLNHVHRCVPVRARNVSMNTRTTPNGMTIQAGRGDRIYEEIIFCPSCGNVFSWRAGSWKDFHDKHPGIDSL